jgi:DNA-binding transcriptional regulator YiaG
MDYTPIKKDWARIMRELREHGLTPYKIALTLGIAPCTAQNWERGGEPSHSYGEALMRLYVAHVGAGLPTASTHSM